MQVSSFHFGPHKTPSLVKSLIIITAAISLLSPLLTFLLQHFYQMAGPQAWLSLSLLALLKGWFWQPLSYFFLNSTGVSISISLLFSLIFYLFILWFAGSEIVVRFGSFSFILLYIGGGILSGLLALLLLFLFSSSEVIVGSGPAILSLLIVWVMLYPDLDFYFLFFIKLKAKWLVAILIGISLLFSLSRGAFISLAADFTGLIWGYVIGWMFLKLNPLFFRKKRLYSPSHNDKIIDITAIPADAFFRVSKIFSS